MNVEEKFNTLLERSKAATLSQTEKEKIKSYLLDFVAKNPVAVIPAPSTGQKTPWHARLVNSFSARPIFRYAASSFAVLLVLLFAGVGISFAAQKASPGDPLYSFKININEKVLAWTKFSDQAKAEYDLSLVDTRLKEIETVTAENKLDAFASANVRRLIDNHIVDLNKHVENSNKNNQPSVGVETNSRLEASLNAHAKVLGSISAENANDSQTKDNVSSILSDLKDKANEAKSRLNDGHVEKNVSHDIIDSNEGVNINIK